VPSTPFNYSLDWLTCLLANFLDYLGISKVIILGSSFGGFLAQQFTLNFPERVKHLFIINTAASGSRVPFKIRSMRFLVPFLPSKFFEWLYFLIQSGPTKTLLMTHPQAKSSLPTKKMFLQRLKSIKTFNALPRLPMLSVPTTIFYGIKDNILSPATSKELHQLISNSVLVTLDSGHVPCLEIPIIFNRKLREFLSL
ncbi:MAG: alpha/beta fold hydrolase, partial [Candidatus Hodarchaeota archaeon]